MHITIQPHEQLYCSLSVQQLSIGARTVDKKILVVDDEKSIRKLLKTAFTKAGYTVVLADSAENALEILAHQRDPSP